MKNLRNRFVSDLKVPIPVTEDPYWSKLLSIYPEAEKDWKSLCEGVEKDYAGNGEEFLKDFYEAREKAIQWIKANPTYCEFNECKDMATRYPIEQIPQAPKGDIYNQERVGKFYISVDLRKANFQVVKFITDYQGSYEDWIGQFTGKTETLKWYCSKSKYLRQVIFGNCNPKRQIHVEKYLISKLYKYIDPENHTNIFGNLVQFGCDEMIWEVPIPVPIDVEEYCSVVKALREMSEVLEAQLKADTGLDLRLECFKLNTVHFKTVGGHTLYSYIREFVGGTNDYKGIPKHYAAQMYKLMRGESVDPEVDTVFMQDGEVAKFISPIRRASI